MSSGGGGGGPLTMTAGDLMAALVIAPETADLLEGSLQTINDRRASRGEPVLVVAGSPEAVPIDSRTGMPEGFLGIDEYRAGVPTVVPWVAEPYVCRGMVTLVSGPPKAGKSTLMSQLQMCRETGDAFLGLPVETGPTLLVTEEGGVAVVHKTQGLHELVVYDRKASKGETFEEALAKVGVWLDANPNGLVFIDTLAVWATIEDENDASSTTAAIGRVMLLAQTKDAAIVIVHHSRKGGGANGEAIRGSGAILATPDISVEVKRVKEGTDDRYLDVQGRVVFPNRYLVGFDRDTMRYRLLDQTDADEAAVEADLEGLPVWKGEAFSEPGFSKKEVEDTWGRGRQDRRIDFLVQNGRLHVGEVQKGRAKAKVYWAVLRRLRDRGESRDDESI